MRWDMGLGTYGRFLLRSNTTKRWNDPSTECTLHEECPRAKEHVRLVTTATALGSIWPYATFYE
jgi:hypothetical protein